MDLRGLKNRIDLLVERTGKDLPRVELVGYGKRDYPGEPDGTLCGGGPIYRYDTKAERDAIRERIAAMPEGVHRIVFHFVTAEEIAAGEAVAL
jgi:hypothetical protein